MTQKAPPPQFENWSPRMALAEYERGNWCDPRVAATGEVAIHPGAMSIQFGQSVFEGCRAFWDGEGEARVFRLGDHYDRFAASCERLLMPVPPRRIFMDAVKDQVGEASSWTQPFASETLYIRPILYGEDHHVMPLPSARNTFVVLTAPLRLFPHKGLALFAERQFSRAARGGLGCAKTAANYAHQYYPTKRAREAGCDAVLWLDAETHSFIEEASTMNIFMVLGGALVTPQLQDTILAGITRRSVIALVRDKYSQEVVERAVTLEEVAQAAETGTLTEMFTCSTALGLRPVARIVDGERTVEIPGEDQLTARLQEDLLAIQSGRAPDRWGWTTSVPVTEHAAG